MPSTKIQTELTSYARLHSTIDGDLLYATNPTIRTDFIAASESECIHQQVKPELPFIGEGMRGRVVALDSKYCVKTYGPSTGRIAHLTGRATKKPSLVNEMRFMEQIRHKMARRDPAITIPTMYYTCTFPGRNTTSMLQDRLPDDATGLLALAHADKDRFIDVACKLRTRIQDALGSSVLRFGIGDLRGDGALHTGNVFINQDLDPEGNIYLIDLIGNRRIRALGARTLSLT